MNTIFRFLAFFFLVYQVNSATNSYTLITYGALTNLLDAYSPNRVTDGDDPPTYMTYGAVPDTTFLKRSGTNIIGAALSTADLGDGQYIVFTTSNNYLVGSNNFAGSVRLSGGTLYINTNAAPSTPAPGQGVVYYKADRKLYYKTDLGLEVDLTAGTGGGSGNVTLIDTNNIGWPLVLVSDYNITPTNTITMATANVGTMNLTNSVPGNKVTFADTDANYVATNVQAAIEELDDFNASGPNASDGKVEWSQLTGVPAGFADGSDDGGGGSGYNVISEEGSTLTARTNLNFIGDSFSVTDNAGATRTDVTANTHLEDLADGTLSGSKVGSGINADNITTGTLSSNRIDSSMVRLAGQLGGTGASPDVRGLREAGGGTLLTMGTVLDGQALIRSGNNLVGYTPDSASTTITFITTNGTKTYYYTNSMSQGYTRLIESRLLAAGETNKEYFHIGSLTHTRTGAMTGNTAVWDKRGTSSFQAGAELSETNILFHATGWPDEPVHWIAMIDIRTQTNAAPESAPPASCDVSHGGVSGTTAGSSPLGNQNSTRWLATKFVATVTTNICRIDVPISKNGSPTFDITAQIYSHDSGADKPNILFGSDATSSVNAATLVSGTETGSTVSFTDIGADIVSGTTYWVVLKATTEADTSNYVNWYRISESLANGIRGSGDNGVSWNAQSSTRRAKFTLYSN